MDVRADKSANGLFNHVEQIVKFGDKLVAQTYDGAAEFAKQERRMEFILK